MKKKVKSTMMDSPMIQESKPSMNIKSSHMPSIKGMKIGSMIGMHVKGKVTGIRQSYDDPNVHNAEIEIHSIKPVKKGFASHIGGVVK